MASPRILKRPRGLSTGLQQTTEALLKHLNNILRECFSIPAQAICLLHLSLHSTRKVEYSSTWRAAQIISSDCAVA